MHHVYSSRLGLWTTFWPAWCTRPEGTNSFSQGCCGVIPGNWGQRHGRRKNPLHRNFHPPRLAASGMELSCVWSSSSELELWDAFLLFLLAVLCVLSSLYGSSSVWGALRTSSNNPPLGIRLVRVLFYISKGDAHAHSRRDRLILGDHPAPPDRSEADILCVPKADPVKPPVQQFLLCFETTIACHLTSRNLFHQIWVWPLNLC